MEVLKSGVGLTDVFDVGLLSSCAKSQASSLISLNVRNNMLYKCVMFCHSSQ